MFTGKTLEEYDTVLFVSGIATRVAAEDVAAGCSECGRTVLHSDLETTPELLDDWEEGGDEAYCPTCSKEHNA